MFMKTLAIGNVHVSRAKQKEKPEIWIEKILLKFEEKLLKSSCSSSNMSSSFCSIAGNSTEFSSKAGSKTGFSSRADGNTDFFRIAYKSKGW